MSLFVSATSNNSLLYFLVRRNQCSTKTMNIYDLLAIHWRPIQGNMKTLHIVLLRHDITETELESLLLNWRPVTSCQQLLTEGLIVMFFRIPQRNSLRTWELWTTRLSIKEILDKTLNDFWTQHIFWKTYWSNIDN